MTPCGARKSASNVNGERNLGYPEKNPRKKVWNYYGRNKIRDRGRLSTSPRVRDRDRKEPSQVTWSGRDRLYTNKKK